MTFRWPALVVGGIVLLAGTVSLFAGGAETSTPLAEATPRTTERFGSRSLVQSAGQTFGRLPIGSMTGPDGGPLRAETPNRYRVDADGNVRTAASRARPRPSRRVDRSQPDRAERPDRIARDADGRTGEHSRFVSGRELTGYGEAQPGTDQFGQQAELATTDATAVETLDAVFDVDAFEMPPLPDIDLPDFDLDALLDGFTLTGGSVPTTELVFVEIATNDCEELAGQRTNDLYVRISDDWRILTVDSGPSAGLTIDGGAFFQDPLGSDLPPSQAEVDALPCLAYDTYLQLGDADVQFVGEEPSFAGGLLDATWFAIDAPAVQRPDLFGDDDYYLPIGRFTAPEGVSVGGSLLVTIAPPGVGLPRAAVLTVPDCATCWTGPGPDGGSGGDDQDDDGGSDGGGDGGDVPGLDEGGGVGSTRDGLFDDGSGDDAGAIDREDAGDADDLGLRWIAVDNASCLEGSLGGDAPTIDLAGTRTFDLVVRMDAPHQVTLAATGISGVDPLRFSYGTAFQHPSGLNVPPPPGLIALYPCIEFDSYFAIGAASSLGFLPGSEPMSFDWGSQLETGWFTTFAVVGQRDKPRFGDGAFYVRLMRCTLPEEVAILGQLEVGLKLFGTDEAITVILDAPLLPEPMTP